MSGITLEQAQAQLDALLTMQSTNVLALSVGGRSYSYRTFKDLLEAISFWERKVQSLTRAAAGGPRHSFAVADFTSSR